MGVLLAPRRGVKRGGGKGGSSRTGDNLGGEVDEMTELLGGQ